jgi:hypothetical protein
MDKYDTACHFNIYADSHAYINKDKHQYSCKYADIYIDTDKYNTAGYIDIYADSHADLYKNSYADVYINEDEHGSACHVYVYMYGHADIYQDKHKYTCEYINIHINQDSHTYLYAYGYAVIYTDADTYIYRNQYKYSITHNFKHVDPGVWHFDEYAYNNADVDKQRQPYKDCYFNYDAYIYIYIDKDCDAC